MRRSGTRKPDRERDTRRANLDVTASAIDHGLILIETVCALAGSEQLIGATNPERKRLQHAIATHDTPALFGYLVEAFSYQGISDAALPTRTWTSTAA